MERRLAAVLIACAAAAVPLLAAGTGSWPGAAPCRAAGVLVLLATPWLPAATALVEAGRSRRPGRLAVAGSLLALALLAVAL